jgi:hypothetical protein
VAAPREAVLRSVPGLWNRGFLTAAIMRIQVVRPGAVTERTTHDGF